MDTPKLDHLLRQKDLTPEELLVVPGIVSQIRNQIEKFVTYLRCHKGFTLQMLTLGLDVTYSQLEDDKMRQASYAVTELLANEETCIAELFFE